LLDSNSLSCPETKADCKRETVLNAPPAPPDVPWRRRDDRTAFCTFLKARTSLWRHPLARDPEFLGELFERNRIIDETARLEDAPLAVAEHP
jgi:hypothetical protein